MCHYNQISSLIKPTVTHKLKSSVILILLNFLTCVIVGFVSELVWQYIFVREISSTHYLTFLPPQHIFRIYLMTILRHQI
jgi:hypothetical protein